MGVYSVKMDFPLSEKDLGLGILTINARIDL